MNSERLLERFLRYVQVDTTANDATQAYPSSPGQLDLGRILVQELDELGLEGVIQDEHGLVWATIPATAASAAPVVALNAHLDTSPETSGSEIKPQVIRGYEGGDISLPGAGELSISVADNPALSELQGSTLITTDGTTLLGSDDKAGVAIIVETAAYLMEHPEILHGPVRLLFTCDEEIGRGVQHVALDRLQADVCYTLDGGGAGDIDVETFSADLATVRFRGVNIHPSIAKGRMVNALKAMGDFLCRLPSSSLSPETTEGRDGFLHPYHTEGGVGEATLKVLLRSFDTSELAEQLALLRKIAAEVERDRLGMEITVDVAKQYRNMAEGLAGEPRAVAYAQKAHDRLRRPSKLTIIRGGTDGSALTEKGLPTPNLSSGQHNPHSPLEWACLDQMKAAAEHLVELVQVWAEDQSSTEASTENRS